MRAHTDRENHLDEAELTQYKNDDNNQKGKEERLDLAAALHDVGPI